MPDNVPPEKAESLDELLDLATGPDERAVDDLDVYDRQDGWVRLDQCDGSRRRRLVTSNYLGSEGRLRVRPRTGGSGYVCLVPAPDWARRLALGDGRDRTDLFKRSLACAARSPDNASEFILAPNAGRCDLAVSDTGGGILSWNGIDLTDGVAPIILVDHQPCPNFGRDGDAVVAADPFGNPIRCDYRSSGDRVTVRMHYTVNRPPGRAVPVTFHLRADQPAAPNGVAHIPFTADEHIDCHAATGEYRNYVILGNTPLGYLGLRDGAFLGAFDPDMSNCIFRGLDDGRIEVTRWFHPQRAGDHFEWTFELLGGYDTFPAAFLRATWPYTVDNRCVFGGAMGRIEPGVSDAIDAADVPQTLTAMRDRGVAWVMRHNWFSAIGEYHHDDHNDDTVYRSSGQQQISRQRLRREADVLHANDIQYLLYTAYANCAEPLAERFAESLVRDAAGRPIRSGADGKRGHLVANIWVNPSPELPYGQSIVDQVDKLCRTLPIDGIYIDGLGRLDDHQQLGLWDRAHRDGSAAPIDYYERGATDLPPAASVNLAGRDLLTQIRRTLDRHNKRMVLNTTRPMAFARLADAFQIEMHIDPQTVFMAKCLGNGREMFIKGNVMNYAKTSRTTGLARNVCAILTQNYPAPQTTVPFLPPFARRIDIAPQRLLAIIAQPGSDDQFWLFPNAMARLAIKRGATVYPENITGSWIRFRDDADGDIRGLAVERDAIVVTRADGSEQRLAAIQSDEYDIAEGEAIVREMLGHKRLKDNQCQH